MFHRERLEKAMEELHISQTKLSDMTRIGKSSISQYLSGKNIPSRKRIIKIAEALGIEQEELWEEEKKPPISEGVKIRKMTPDDAAKIMGVAAGVIRNGLQDGVFPWGYAIRGKGKRYVYFINAKRFAETEGVVLEEETGMKENKDLTTKI